jgi:hypothetical protein
VYVRVVFCTYAFRRGRCGAYLPRPTSLLEAARLLSRDPSLQRLPSTPRRPAQAESAPLLPVRVPRRVMRGLS